MATADKEVLKQTNLTADKQVANSSECVMHSELFYDKMYP